MKKKKSVAFSPTKWRNAKRLRNQDTIDPRWRLPPIPKSLKTRESSS